MYQLIKQIPDASSPFIDGRDIVYTQGDKQLVRMDDDFNATTASGEVPFVLEGLCGSYAIIRTKEHIMALDQKNRVTMEYPLLLPTEIALVHKGTLFMTTTIEQEGRIDNGKYLGHHSLYDYRGPDEPPVIVNPDERSFQIYENRMYVLDSENTLYIFEEDRPFARGYNGYVDEDDDF